MCFHLNNPCNLLICNAAVGFVIGATLLYLKNHPCTSSVRTVVRHTSLNSNRLQADLPSVAFNLLCTTYIIFNFTLPLLAIIDNKT